MPVCVEERSSTTIEIMIPIEWYALGKDVCMRYAENIAGAVYLGTEYRATSAVPKGEQVIVRLIKSNR